MNFFLICFGVLTFPPPPLNLCTLGNRIPYPLIKSLYQIDSFRISIRYLKSDPLSEVKFSNYKCPNLSQSLPGVYQNRIIKLFGLCPRFTNVKYFVVNWSIEFVSFFISSSLRRKIINFF